MDLVHKLLTKMYRQLGTPLAKAAQAALDEGGLAKVCTMAAVNPRSYTDGFAYFRDACVTGLVRKLQLPTEAKPRRDKAVSLFWSCEAQNKKTNVRLDRYRYGLLECRDDVAVYEFITQWRKEISRMLGRPSWNLTPRFSPGATLSDKGKLTTIPDKMLSRPTSYRRSANLYTHYFMGTPQHRRHSAPKVCRGNSFFTVPKDWNKDRGCCKEASIAVALQLDVGVQLKVRLAKTIAGPLEDRPSRHHALAKHGSVMGDLATIDLSNASDTVSRSLVELVMPDSWLELLNSLRSTHTNIDGQDVYLEKYSSMGNGFTFELETVIFQSLCYVICGRRPDVSVFGDDIIVPTKFSAAVLAALKFFGFTPNVEKTFCDGPFRESCGGDYFRGQAVRPHFLKELPDDPQAWMALHNGICRLEDQGLALSSVRHVCVDAVPIKYRSCRGPRRLGDAVFWDDSHEPTYRGYSTLTGGKYYENSPTYFFRCLIPVNKRFEVAKYFPVDVVMSAGSLGVPAEIAPRGKPDGYRLGWIPAYGVDGTAGWCG